MGRFNQWDTPWLNPKLIAGAIIIGIILLGGIVGRFVWNTDLAYTASSPLNLPPPGFVNTRGQEGTWDHPLGTENSGRDMLAVIILGAPNSFLIGVVAATVGMGIGIILGFTAGFLGGRVDEFIRLISDVTITIPSLMVLIVIQTLIRQVEIPTMAIMIAAFAWPSPTRLIRAQVLSMRESGYVQMAKLSGASTFDIMFREMMPNLIPYLFASFIGNATGAILAAVGLETLGLGPQRIPTLGGTIYDAIQAAALLRNMWWWWGIPTLLLATMFIGLLLINLGFDEIANPRLRRSSQ
ncbi:MAG: ABC transporter permease [Anaerolineae bacterium]|nr:ABC transporter permease [Anaerolineae bacterium]MCA9889683.1 ABC transporter permease [Anaerolineae bacterium]MCA9895780.1 ABC transporter permease [Anaerolineae bacterium]